MMNIKSLFLSFALVVASATTGSAVTHILGDVTGGASTTQTLRVQTVDFIEFSLDASSGQSVSEMVISVTSTPGSNFREMIALYSGSGLVARSARGAGNGGGTATLSFLGADALADGSYTLAIGAWKAFFPTNIAEARSTAYFNNGQYTATFAPSISVVPLPAGVLLLLSGFGALSVLRRRMRKA
ncbi:VPLPA-CTERM sorting domain-containing protein [Tateyamaria armeniaca]|uniref:VPLPA-CTERM sorting domain-containing protein n=1 Tax=Tateyamaria armeniaca TaxID=2518930 RepID=A0ABW8UZE7_9RHOB